MGQSEGSTRGKVIIRPDGAYLTWLKVRHLVQDVPDDEMAEWADRGLEWREIEGEAAVKAEELETFLLGGGGSAWRPALRWRLCIARIVCPSGLDSLLENRFHRDRALKSSRPAPKAQDELPPQADRLLGWVCREGDPRKKGVDALEDCIPFEAAYDTKRVELIYVRSLKVSAIPA